MFRDVLRYFAKDLRTSAKNYGCDGLCDFATDFATSRRTLQYREVGQSREVRKSFAKQILILREILYSREVLQKLREVYREMSRRRSCYFTKSQSSTRSRITFAKYRKTSRNTFNTSRCSILSRED